MKNILFIVAACILTGCSVSKTQSLCPTQTLNQFMLFHAKQLHIRNADTLYMQHFIKCKKGYIPKLGDVVKVDNITGVIITKPIPQTGRKGQSIVGRVSSPQLNGGYWGTWWEFRMLAQSKNCSTSVYKTNADAQPKYFTRLSNF